MFTRELRQGEHVKKFTISESPKAGWEVREEADSKLVRVDRYNDWHRLERARLRIDAAVAELEHSGWR